MEKITQEVAKKVLQEEQKKKITTCQKEVESILNKHKCQLTAEARLTTQGVAFQVLIVPAPEPPSKIITP